ncbi:Early phosphoprotein [Trichinella spiralis]|uniref:Early phosphoprotein n=1 Tax=Trichinella spiralis TaxID=6334 RepID=A0ABR3K5A3_TRISP
MIEVTGDGDASRYLYSRGLIVFSRRLTARQRHKSTSAPIYWTLVLHCMVNAHPTGRTLVVPGGSASVILPTHCRMVKEPLMGTEERRLQNGAGSQRTHTDDVDL